MTAALAFEPGSYRDRDARVFRNADGTICRALAAQALENWVAVREAAFFRHAMADGRIVRSADLADSALPPGNEQQQWAGALCHETIPFVSYPFEWSFGMLREAALLQLELLAEALQAGFTLKDGTAYNLQWIGARPVFIDVASFEPHVAGRPWAGYRQFCQTTLNPLLIQAYRQVPFQPWLRGCLEGISPEQCARILGWRGLLRRGTFKHVWLHSRLEAWAGATHDDVPGRLPKAGFDATMVQRLVRDLTHLIRGLKWTSIGQEWKNYPENNSYSSADTQAKQAFVRTAVQSRFWPLTWDLGANTGTFSRIAAENSDVVIAMDADQGAVESLYQSLKFATARRDVGGTVLPLLVNLADPSPGLGWRGRERLPLAARGRPDLILCLALVHHLVFTAGIPLDDVVNWLADQGAELIIEFVDRGDPMVTRLLRNRRDNYSDYRKDAFEHRLFARFDLQSRLPLSCGTRELYHVRPRS